MELPRVYFRGGGGARGCFRPPLGSICPPLGIGFSVLLIWGCPSLALYLPPPPPPPLEFLNLVFAPLRQNPEINPGYLCVSLMYFSQKVNEDSIELEFYVQIITLGLTLSFAGWIADVCFGRYGVIYWSMWIMCAALMLATVSSVLTRTVDSYTSNIHSYVNGVLWTIMAVGFGGFQANVIQFSFMMPQLMK